MTIEPALRSRIWIDGELLVDQPVTLNGVDWVGAEHAGLCAEAEREGRRWLIEISDPEGDHDGLPLRFGSDTQGMVDPIQIDLDTLPDIAEARTRPKP